MEIQNSFSLLTHERIVEIEELISRQADGFHPDIKSALNILLSAGGKRVRPILTLLVGDMLGAEQKRLVTMAASIELLHTATLVHDDLIDESLLRRGTPTLNSKWSPGATVLTGDFLFSRAAMLAAETNSLAAMKIFAATLSQIVNGEINQLLSKQISYKREDYYQRIEAKTASLFRTSTCTAAIISESNQKIINGMSNFGYNIGMAFQILDDILDLTGEQEKLGKPIGSDLRQGLITLPTILFLENYPNDEHSKLLINGNLLNDAEKIDVFISKLQWANTIQESLKIAQEYVDKAISYLDGYCKSLQHDALLDLAKYIVDRTI